MEPRQPKLSVWKRCKCILFALLRFRSKLQKPRREKYSMRLGGVRAASPPMAALALGARKPLLGLNTACACTPYACNMLIYGRLWIQGSTCTMCKCATCTYMRSTKYGTMTTALRARSEIRAEAKRYSRTGQQTSPWHDRGSPKTLQKSTKKKGPAIQAPPARPSQIFVLWWRWPALSLQGASFPVSIQHPKDNHLKTKGSTADMAITYRLPDLAHHCLVLSK